MTTETSSEPAPGERPSIRKWSQLRRIVELLGPYRLRFGLATLALLAGSGLTLIYPQGARYAIDLGISDGSIGQLDRVLVLLAAAFTANAALIWLRHYLMSWLGERAVADLRGMVFDRILTLPAAWFHERRTGELVGRLASDVSIIQGVVGSELSIALRNIVQLIGGLILLAIVSVELTLAMLLIVPPLVIGTLLFGRVIRRMAKRVQDKLAEASGQVQESIGAITTVQAFVRERAEASTYRSKVEDAFNESVHLATWRASFFSTASTAGYVAIAGVIWLGGRRVIAGEISPGELTAFLLYTFMVAASLANVAGLWSSLQRAAGATERLFDIVDTVPEIDDPADPAALPEGGGAIELRNVQFHYASRPDHPVLRNVDLSIAPGEVVALVGPSGAGKTTITSLIMRFFDVVDGAVTFEGVDARGLRLADLRGAMAIVSQEPVLFSGSLRDNIAYGNPAATAAAVERAARDANAHDFVMAFPDGYDTQVGERGVKLSGGQRQRIAIARAILIDPRVLILDEATSNLDAESEALVQSALARLMQGRTTVVIAHRLSTVRDADRIVLVEGGAIVEQGTHGTLMQENGVYRRLVEHQLVVA